MYDIYIKNYCLRNGTYVTDETLMYSIPMAPNDDNALTDPKVTVEMGKAGSFEFTMNFWHPYYESLRQMKTIFRIVYDGDTIFRGRVLTIDTGHMTGVKKVHCEGDMAFLLDSQAEGIPDTTRPKTNALTYIQTLLSNHNSQMANDMADKQFALGQVPGTYTSSITEPQQLHPDNNYRYGSSSWKDSQSAFVELSDSFGGFWRTRYQNGTTYLDWLDNYYDTTINPQIVEIGENILDISSSSEVNNIFTALIPVGSNGGNNLYINGYQTAIHGNNNYILVPQILQVFSDAELNSGFHSKHDYASAVNDYGLIFRTESFSNADTQEKLWQYATDWIKNNYCGGLSQFSVGAMDMHHVGESIGKYLLGGRVTVVYPDVDHRDTNPEAVIQKVMTVMKIVYNLNNPEKNQYTIGIPNAILKKNYGEKKSKKGGGSGAKVSADAAQTQKNDSFENRFEYGNELIWEFVCDSEHNKKVFDKYAEEKGDAAAAAIQKAAYIMVSRAVQSPDPEERKYAQSIIMDGENNALLVKGKKFRSPEIDEYNETLTSILVNGNRNAIDIFQDVDEIPSAANWDLDKRPAIMEMKATGGSGAFNFMKVLGQDTDNPGVGKVAAIVDGAKELVGSVKVQAAGSIEDIEKVADGEMLAAAGLDGSTANIFTSADGETKNTEIDGSEDGQMNVGKNQNDDWLVVVNDKVTYRDQSGNTHTMEPGFVTANDFAIANNNVVPSFRTKLAVMDTAIANNLSVIGTLTASVADIETITSQFSIVSKGVYTSRLEADSIGSRGDSSIDGDLTVSKSLYVGKNVTIGSGIVGATTANFTNLYIGSSTGGGRTIGEAVRGFGTATPSGGQISIPYYTFGGDEGSINFNIADTAYYKAGIGIKSVGAWVWDGENKVFTSTITPNDGETETVTTPSVSTVVNKIEYKPNLHSYDISVSSVSNGNELSGVSTWSDTSAYEDGLAQFSETSVTVLGSAATSVTVQGSPTSVTLQGGATSIYKQGAETSVTVQGELTSVTAIANAYTGCYVQGSTTSVSVSGSSTTVTIQPSNASLVLSHYGNATLYSSTSATYGITHDWYYVNARGVAYYGSGSRTTLYTSPSSATYRLNGSWRTFYAAGSPATYYTAGNARTYYLENNTPTTYRTRGVLVDLYEEGSQATFYSGGSPVTYYTSGGSHTYYTKK